MHTHGNRKSLEEVNESINTTNKKSWWRRLLAFLGPAYLVSVGYMDPGNWATGIEGGSQFGYTLIWVMLMSNLMALLLQSLCARLGVVGGMDLAQASRKAYNPFINFVLYILAEIAIVATDLAEVVGMAIGLNLLFGLPMVWGVSITALDTFLLLFLLDKGMRKMEAFIIGLIFIIAGSFFVELFFAQPDFGAIAEGFIPSIPNETALYISIGIIGATVMPHNLYLHSSLVQSRKIKRTKKGLKEALRFNFIDSAVALNVAFLVNAAILILSASVFFANGIHVAEIQDAYKLLQPMLGTEWAPKLFALALLAAGQSSTLTGTLAGQIVMEGHLNLRIQPWVRRLITRLLAIIPALFTVIYFGSRATGELLVLSQVVLSLQLGFAMIPLIHFVSQKKQMKGFHIKWPLKIASWLVTLIIVGLNAQLVINKLESWIATSAHPFWIWSTMIPLSIGFALLLLYITFKPLFKGLNPKSRPMVPHITKAKIKTFSEPISYAKIAIAVDFSTSDKNSIATALQLGGKEAHYTLIHVVESAGARMYGKDIGDYETESDRKFLQSYQEELESRGFEVVTKLGFGSAKKSIPKIMKTANAEGTEDFDLLVLGSHGHKGFKDLLFGTTVDSVRHKVNVPVFIV